MRIVGYHCNSGTIVNSDKEVCTESPYLDFLLEPKDNAIKVFWNMGYDIANLLKMTNITEEQGHQLYDNLKLNLTPYTLNHFPGKYLNISKAWYSGRPLFLFVQSFRSQSQYTVHHYLVSTFQFHHLYH